MSASILFIGGMDSSGGAGLLRDAATALALAAPYRVAVTAVTAQNDQRLSASLPMPPEIGAAQIALAAETGIAAAKTGMLANRAVVEAVAASLPPLPLVVDPVLCSSSGHALLDTEGIAALLALLLPRTTLLTPNLPELAVLAGHLGLAGASEAKVAAALLARGCAAVLVKGGHGDDPALCEDRLYRRDQPLRSFQAPRIATSLRGTGCQLASAIAIGLATGLALEPSIARAKAMLSDRFAKAAAIQIPHATLRHCP